MANELDSLDYFIVVCEVCGQYDEVMHDVCWDSCSHYTCKECETRQQKQEAKHGKGEPNPQAK